MNSDLRKRLDLSKQVVLDLTKNKGIEGLVSRVVLCLDFSGSMDNLYKNGKVQAVLERLVPIAMTFDDNGSMELFIFHNNAYRHGKDVSEGNIEGFIKREIMPNYSFGGTNYAPSIELILQECISTAEKKKTGGGMFSSGTVTYCSDIPTYVIFITDGENGDKGRAEKAIKEASYAPVFFQFVGIGNASFSFLRKLDEMDGRFIDNANFFSIDDLTKVSDMALYDQLLNEFPSWLKEAKSKGLLK